LMTINCKFRIKGVDLKTLEGVDNSYLKDKDSVYLIDENRLRRLERLDPATFRNAGAGYVRDKMEFISIIRLILLLMTRI